MSTVNLSASGPPETIIPDPNPALAQALAAAGTNRDAVAAVVASAPTFLDGWAMLGDLGRDTLESYAYYRIGYHRGLSIDPAFPWQDIPIEKFRNPQRGIDQVDRI